MKMYAVFLGLVLTTVLALCATLRPSAIVYGDLRDAYGIQAHSGEQVSAYLADSEVARTAVAYYPGAGNYRLHVDVCDPQSAGPAQVVPGSEIRLRVRAGAVLQPLIGPVTFTAPGHGEAIRMDLVMGTDSDGDGLPDEWEQMVIANSGGLAAGLADVGPGLDLDKDGLNDDQEFWYGSFAFLPGDVLQAQGFGVAGNRLSYSFYSVQGMLYEVEESPRLGAQSWMRCPVSLTQAGPLLPVQFEGTGGMMTFYLLKRPDDTIQYYYRLKAQPGG